MAVQLAENDGFALAGAHFFACADLIRYVVAFSNEYADLVVAIRRFTIKPGRLIRLALA